MTQKEKKQRIGHKSDKFIYWIGSPYSLVFHTIFFAVMIALAFSKIGFDKVMLILTTVVSLEAIYLSIFIQMTVNKSRDDIEEVSEDIDEIQEDVEGIEKDVDEIQEDVEEIQKKDIGDNHAGGTSTETLAKIENNLGQLVEEVLELKRQYKSENKK